MFPRFRKSKTGGFEPCGVNARIQCRGRWCRGITCAQSPRCRWRIGWDETREHALEPYRLHVSLIENRRVDGKVRQEHVAQIGAIDGHLLESFFSGLDPDVAARMKADNWEYLSLWARRAFWAEAIERLRRLENRIGPDMKRLRIAIHKRVPWPIEAERKRLELLEAERNLYWAERGFECTREMYRANEQILERANRQNAELGRASVWEAKQVQEARERLDKARERAGIRAV